MKLTLNYFFPTEFTFWTTLWYVFLFYLIAYIIFNIYIYANNMEYKINCKNKGKCFEIKKKSISTDDNIVNEPSIISP